VEGIVEKKTNSENDKKKKQWLNIEKNKNKIKLKKIKKIQSK
jgi:hypothetical protein